MSSTANKMAVACFGDDQTLRWSARAGEYILWVVTTSILTSNRETSWTIRDFWQMRDSDFVTITNRWPDLPVWFNLHPSEVANRGVHEMQRRLDAGYQPTEPMDGASIWRIKAGDRLVWVNAASGQAIRELLDFRACALVIGENQQPSADAIMFYGEPEGQELPPAAELAMRSGFKAALELGVPRVFAEDWKFGA